MIELTVKTLDSQNHGFTVPDDTTVKQLKDKIAESINIPADSQRLIYCGRVLVDEKNLSEYDVNGKVIHLVHRPPPQASRSNGNNSGGRSSNQQPRRANHQHRQTRMDGNAMYLGAMAFPADLMDAQGIQPPQPSHNLSQSRLIVARRMIRRASAVLQRLELPELEDPDTTPEDAENGSGSYGENGSNGASNVLSQAQPFTGSIAHAAQAATAAAIAAAVSAAHAAGVPNITIVRGGQPQGSQETVNIRIEGSGSEEGATRSEQEQANSSETGETSQQANTQTTQPSTENSSTSGSGIQSRRSTESPRTNDMASLLDSLNRINERLQPFIQQYHQLMRDDPVFEPDSTALQEAQRVFNSVSEVMHFLSHAYHAMSDIMCEFSSTPPRNLRCRPVLIQHSAVLQAGIPIQAQINVMANRPNTNTSSQTSAQADTTTPSIPASAAAPSSVPVPSSGTPNGQTAVSTDRAANQTQDTPNTNQSRPNVSQGQTQGFPHPSFNITPGNVEFFMEVGPGSITIDSLEATVVTNSNTSGAQTGADSNGGNGNFPWGSPPPPEFIQNLMQAVAGHVMGRSGGVPHTNATSQPGATGAGTSAIGQNSQARGNTATHPTTSTQTRSTSRPHVHLAPATVQGLGSTNFDPFLPCNSHHVRTFRRRQRAQQTQQQSADNSNAEPQTAEQTSEQQQPQQQQQEQEQQQRQGLNTQTSPSSQSQSHPQQIQPRPQSEPQQPQQQQQQQQQQSQPQPGNIFNLISNIIGNMQGGAPPGLGVPFSFQVPPAMHVPTPSGMSSTTTNRASAGPNPPPGLSLLMNMMGGQGPSGAGETAPPFNLPFMSEMLQNLSGGLGGAFFVQGSGPTLADLLQSFPDHSYTEGESIFADLAMTLARNLTFQDIIAQRFGQVNSLNHIQPHLREFILQRVLQGQAPNQENISASVNRLIAEMRPHFDVMLEARLRDEVDLIATANQYNQMRLPEVITLIMTGNNSTFGQELVQWCRRYVDEMGAILMHCCIDGSQGLETIIQNFVQRLTSGMHPGVQQWTVGSSVTHFRSYVSRLDIPFERIQRYLVYRIPGTAEPIVTPPSSASVQQTSSDTEQVASRPAAEPMETDGTAENGRTSTVVHSKEDEDRNLAMDTDSLPDVLLGSEAWHNSLPSEWVPIIARDTQRQRKQNSQPPFSDAYLAGMPSKRRKIVTSAKPQGSLSQIIADSVNNAVDAAGVDAVTGLETVTQVAGNDPEIQAAYREQVRVLVRDNLTRNPDFTAEKFPNTAKYFK